jgi:RNA-binding protein YhbY
MKNQIRTALANHPLIGIQGLSSLLCSDKKELKKALKEMKATGEIEVRGRYYKLKPMYKQLELYNEIAIHA